MFALGDKEWPGLSKLSEECGEVVQVIGKLMGTRGGVDHWDGTNLKHRLEDEIADVMAAAQFVIRYCGLEDKTIEHRIMQKLVRFETWHHGGDPPAKHAADCKGAILDGGPCCSVAANRFEAFKRRKERF